MDRLGSDRVRRLVSQTEGLPLQLPSSIAEHLGRQEMLRKPHAAREYNTTMDHHAHRFLAEAVLLELGNDLDSLH